MRRKLIVSFLIFSFITVWLYAGQPKLWENFPPDVPKANAGVGSVYIARAPGTSLISNDSLSTEQTLTYDTEVVTSADITRQSGNQAFRIQNTGRYLIIANTRWNYADIGNNNRHVLRTSIKVGGTALSSIYGMASGYGRDSGSADEDGAVVVAYIDHTVTGGSGDDITFHVQNFGDTSVALADQIADVSGIQIIRMPDDSEYLQVKRTSDIALSGTLDYSTGDPTWNEFGWESQDAETNTSVLEWVSGNDVTLKSAGHYLVIYAVNMESFDAREAAIYRLKLDDVEIPASRVLSYVRSNDGDDEGWVQWAGIIEASASDVLNIDWGSATETDNDGDLVEAAMTVVKLPDTASYIRTYYDSDRAGETTGAFPFNQEDEDDEGIHDNATNNSRLNGTSDSYDWLFFGSWYLRNVTEDSTRTSEHFRWFRNGTEVEYGSGLSYTRGDQSTTGVPAGGRSAALIAHDLGASDYIELNLRLESGTGNQSRDFIANRVGITGVAIDTLVPSNSLPVASGVSIDSGASSVTLTENTTKTVSCVGTVTDTDGYTDIANVGAFFFRTNNGTSTANDPNHKYELYGDSECAPSGGSGNSETYTCDFSVEYYADATDAGSPNSATDWTCEMWPADNTATGTVATDTVEMNSLVALDVTSPINYGDVDPGQDTGATNQSITVTNTGNVDMDPQVSGGVMSSGPNTISVNNQEYSSDNFTFGAGIDLSASPTTINLILPQRTSTVITDLLYWGLGVPEGTPAGSYTGTNTLSATSGI